MKSNARFIKSVLQTAKTCDTQMPWSRKPRKTVGSADVVPRRQTA